MCKDDQKKTCGNGPTFIVGMNGSGTTMLVDSLGNHPDLYVFPWESCVLPYFISRLSQFGDLDKLSSRRKLADALGKSWAFWFTNKRKPVILKDSELNQPGFSGVVDDIFMHFAKAEGKFRWAEKTPMYLQHIEVLSQQFPDARFIHIYRDGRDVAQSFHRRYMKEPRWTIYRWKKILKMGRAQGQKLGSSRYLEVRYETLTNNPQHQIEMICDFLDLKYYPSLCQASFRHITSDNKIESILPNSKKWLSYFSTEQLKQLELIAGDFLEELGYPVNTVKGSVNPYKWQLIWWEINDRLISTRNQFNSRGGLRYIPRFTRKVVSALRQRRTNSY